MLDESRNVVIELLDLLGKPDTAFTINGIYVLFRFFALMLLTPQIK